jgi:nicotinamidase/pyrazinamidase
MTFKTSIHWLEDFQMSEFIIVVDAQADFMKKSGALYVNGAEELIPAMNQYLHDLPNEETAGVLFTFDTHKHGVYEASEEGAMFNGHCFEYEEGWQLAVSATIKNGIPVYHMKKGVFDMWKEPELTIAQINGDRYDDVISLDRDTFFNILKARGVTKIKFIGVASEFCVMWAMQGALARGFEVIVERNLVRGINKQIDQVVAEEFIGHPVTIV